MRLPPRRNRRLAYAGAAWGFVLLGVLGIAAAPPHGRLPEDFPTSPRSYDDARLARVVTGLAGRRVSVHCWSTREWEQKVAVLAKRWPQLPRLGAWSGYTDGGQINLAPQLCAVLESFSRAKRVPADAAAWSLGALAHESVHASGDRNEWEAECFGMQSIRRAAVALGHSRADGQRLAERYWRRWYPWKPDGYTSAQCRNGGGLDLRPYSDVWP